MQALPSKEHCVQALLPPDAALATAQLPYVSELRMLTVATLSALWSQALLPPRARPPLLNPSDMRTTNAHRSIDGESEILGTVKFRDMVGGERPTSGTEAPQLVSLDLGTDAGAAVVGMATFHGMDVEAAKAAVDRALEASESLSLTAVVHRHLV